MEEKEKKRSDMIIIGGLGHVGLPLGLVFADKGLNVTLLDLDEKTAEKVRNGEMPFLEYEADPILKDVLSKGRLRTTTNPEEIHNAKLVIIAIGTPVDEYLNPKTRKFLETLESFKKYFKEDQTIMIRSTVYPNTCKQIYKILTNNGEKKCKLAYCPERIIQGYSVRELKKLPQIVSGMNKEAEKEASEIFRLISPKVIKTSVAEAELIKLFSNAWRYIQFAATNQFYMISSKLGVDYDKVVYAMKEGYGRAATLPGPGFTAGPCLLKDTMQLAASNQNSFLLGHAAMMINEGLPNFLVENLKKNHDLSQKKVGILGMAFKADIDDIRDSLSYKLGKVLRFEGAKVHYSDEHAKNPTFISKEELLKDSDIVVVGVPHSAYKDLEIPNTVSEVVDLWNVVKKN
jgi:UDP-N-acetyl-D-mannosaminuronic acid dehydrogenase